jgi:hypothetical protein
MLPSNRLNGAKLDDGRAETAAQAFALILNRFDAQMLNASPREPFGWQAPAERFLPKGFRLPEAVAAKSGDAALGTCKRQGLTGVRLDQFRESRLRTEPRSIDKTLINVLVGAISRKIGFDNCPMRRVLK